MVADCLYGGRYLRVTPVFFCCQRDYDSETFCLDRLRFTAALFTKTRMVKLRLRSPLSGIANCFTRMFKLTTFC